MTQQMQRKNWTIVIILALCINLVKRFLKNKPNVPVKNIAAVPDYGHERRIDLIEKYMNGTFILNYQNVMNDGCWYGDHMRKGTGIIIPFKKREAHLKVLLPWLQYYLQSLRINYCIFVVEQVDNGRFNKAYLMNAGFDAISKRHPQIGCMIFHDVDLLPEHFGNRYECGDNPIHASLYIDKYNYERDSMNADWGGVVMIETEVMKSINGYSNLFWGWGKEDGDMATRIRKTGYQIDERNENGYFTMLPHIHTWNFRSGKNQNSLESNFYDKTLVLGIQNERRQFDGLSSLRYSVSRVVNRHESGYTHFYMQLKRVEIVTVSFQLANNVTRVLEQQGDENCTYVSVYDAYIHPNFMPHETASLKQETGVDYEKLAPFNAQKKLCDLMGPTCVAIVQESDQLFSLRESYQLVSHDTITEFFPTLGTLSIAHPQVELKQCLGVPGFPFYLGQFDSADQFNFTIEFDGKMFMFPEGELWIAHHLFFENLDTGLIGKQILIDRSARKQFERVTTFKLFIPFVIELALPGFYTINMSLQDVIGQPQFEMTVTFRINANNSRQYKDPKKVFPLQPIYRDESAFLANFLKVYGT